MMNRMEKIEALYKRALGLDEEERFAYLEQECGRDKGLLKEVWALFQSKQKTQSETKKNPITESRLPSRSAVSGERTGSLLGRHRLLEPLGEGGMGSVYKAHDTRLDQIVAVKILSPELSRRRTAIRRFWREAKATAALKHSAVVKLFDLGEDDGVYFIVMEYVDGVTLDQLVQNGPFSTEKAIDILLQVSDALSEAHRKGIVHRDLKSSNLMITRDGNVKILDFGLVKIQRDVGLHAEGGLSADSLTLPGTILGTVTFMSPEQALGKPVDHRTDIFNLGIIAYELLTGRLPFNGTTIAETLTQICREHPPPISSVNPAVPAALETIVRKCLRKDPQQRYSSVLELRNDLENLRQGKPQSRKPTARRSNVFLMAGAAVILLILLLALLWFLL